MRASLLSRRLLPSSSSSRLSSSSFLSPLSSSSSSSSSSPSSSSSSSTTFFSRRSLAYTPYPFGTRTPDNIYRHPFAPVISSPVGDRDITEIFDGAAPEPIFDEVDMKTSTALFYLGTALFILLGVYPWILRHVDPTGARAPVPQDFSHLKRQFGGPGSETPVLKENKEGEEEEEQ